MFTLGGGLLSKTACYSRLRILHMLHIPLYLFHLQDSLRDAILSQPIFPSAAAHRLPAQNEGGGAAAIPRRGHASRGKGLHVAGVEGIGRGGGAQGQGQGQAQGLGEPAGATVNSRERSGSPTPKRQQTGRLPYSSIAAPAWGAGAEGGRGPRSQHQQQRNGGRPPSGKAALPNSAPRLGPPHAAAVQKLALVPHSAAGEVGAVVKKASVVPAAATAARKTTIASVQGSAQAKVSSWVASRAKSNDKSEGPQAAAWGARQQRGGNKQQVGVGVQKNGSAGQQGGGGTLQDRAAQLAQRRSFISVSRNASKNVF